MRLRDFNIVFSGLKLGIHQFNFQLNQAFFDLFDFVEMEKPQLNVDVVLEKKNNLLEFDFNLSGFFTAYCDVTNLPYKLHLSNTYHLIVKFGMEYKDDSEEVIVLSFETYEINIAQYLYESAVLSIPLKKVHPDVISGNLSVEMQELLDKFDAEKEQTEKEESKKTDPRWDALKDLLDN